MVLAYAAADERSSETSLVDGACEVSVTGNRDRFEDGMHWADKRLPGSSVWVAASQQWTWSFKENVANDDREAVAFSGVRAICTRIGV